MAFKPRWTLADFVSDLEVKVQEHTHNQHLATAAAIQSQSKASLTCSFFFFKSGHSKSTCYSKRKESGPASQGSDRSVGYRGGDHHSSHKTSRPHHQRKAAFCHLHGNCFHDTSNCYKIQQARDELKNNFQADNKTNNYTSQKKVHDYVTTTRHTSKYPISTTMIGSNLTQSLPPWDGQAEGGNWPLQEKDLNVIGVTGTALGVLGRVTLTVSLHKKVCPFRDLFYVSENFALPVDGILGLNAMKDLHITINPENHAIVYQGRRFYLFIFFFFFTFKPICACRHECLFDVVQRQARWWRGRGFL